MVLRFAVAFHEPNPCKGTETLGGEGSGEGPGVGFPRT